jgi:hypothetical protein
VKPILNLLKRLVDFKTNMTLPLKMESVVLGHGIVDRSLNYLITVTNTTSINAN